MKGTLLSMFLKVLLSKLISLQSRYMGMATTTRPKSQSISAPAKTGVALQSRSGRIFGVALQLALRLAFWSCAPAGAPTTGARAPAALRPTVFYEAMVKNMKKNHFQESLKLLISHCKTWVFAR